MRSFRILALAAFVVVVAAADGLRGQCVINLNSGFDQENGVTLPEGTQDPEYTVSDDIGNFVEVNPFTVINNVFPIPPWLLNTEDSLWLAPTPNTEAPAANYSYEIVFDLSAEDQPDTLSLVGRWATDDPGIDVVINDVSTGITAAGFTAWTDFTLDAGAGLFIAGANRVRFVVQNGGGPTGFRVEACLGRPLPPERPFNISTGFDQAANRTIADGADDPNYTISGPGIDGVVAAKAVFDDDFPIPPWKGNTVASRWIGVNDPDSNAQPGEFTYRTRVTLAGAIDARLAVLSGGFAADDQLVDVLVNGSSTGASGAGFGDFIPFAVTAGRGLFVAGENVVEFIVSNGGEAANPSGLRVDGEVIEGPPDVELPASEFSLDTGFNDELGTVGDNGALDDHYTIVGPPGSGIGPVAATVVPDNQFPIGPWIGTTARSKWIGTANPSSNGAPGDYTFSIRVELPAGVDAAEARMLGSWTSDNAAVDIRVNGNSLGIGGGGNFTAFTALPIDAGKGFFVNGENVVEFIVNNAPPGDNPVGLRVEAIVGSGEVDPRAIQTGISARGIGPLPAGREDERFLVRPPTKEPPRPAVVIAADGNPIPPWLPNGADSLWIGLDGNDSIGPAGTYTYSVTFDLPPELNPYRAVLKGGWAAAGAGTDVILNGTSLGATAAGSTALAPFPDRAGLGLFLLGPNTLTFMVENAAQGSTGLRVEARIEPLVEASPFDISTGFNRDAGAVYGDGEPDEGYDLTDPFGVSDVAVAIPGFQAPIPPWIANSESSRWIGLPGATAASPGRYVFVTTVTIAGAGAAAEAFIQGVWAFDDAAPDVLINGQSTGHAGAGGFVAWTSFPPDFGKSLFQEGENTIEFLVDNGGADVNPSGLRVDAVVVVSEGPPPVGTPFKRGDSNADGAANIADASFTLNFLFLGGPDPTCSAAADANGDGNVNIADASFLLNFLFLGGRDLPFPFPDCGRVKTAACAVYAPCAGR